MKSLICTLILFLSVTTMVYAQNYQNVVCGNCRGAGGWMTAYGPVYCQVCGGHGYISVPVQNSITFRGNSGAFTRTSYSVRVVSESGTNKGIYSIYLHGGKQYILFGGSWVCIQGANVNSFAYKGNRYYINTLLILT